MKQKILILSILLIPVLSPAQRVTPVPNGDFEIWNNYSNYSDPDQWDTPNEETSAIPLFGTTVVTKSADHQSGSFSARLESKEIFLVGEIPGFITCGELTIDLGTLTYEITGGAPVYDMPTHLKGFYKYFPLGGDSCAIGIGLFKTIGDTVFEVGIGQFSTKDSTTDWAPFSAWIDYDTILQPDTMNIIALSSAQEDMTPGTVLLVDDFYLDYTVGIPVSDPETGIAVYNDKETHRLLVFFDFPGTEFTVTTLYNISGQPVLSFPGTMISNGKQILQYGELSEGFCILEIIHNGKRFVRKYLLN
jgi:hypothetical protein